MLQKAQKKTMHTEEKTEERDTGKKGRDGLVAVDVQKVPLTLSQIAGHYNH
jgi:hypothetical protein